MKLLHLALIPLLGLPMAALPRPGAAVPDPTGAAVKQTTLIEVITQSEETLYFSPNTIYSLPLRVSRTVTVDGVTLPAGTVIEGRLEPVEGGLRYVSSHIQAGGLQRSLVASSDVLRDVKDPRETSAGAITGDAAIGAAGGAILGVILGDGISFGEIIGGAAAGVIVGNVTAQRVVVIEAGQPVILYVDGN
jgi:hypothetical protein